MLDAPGSFGTVLAPVAGAVLLVPAAFGLAVLVVLSVAFVVAGLLAGGEMADRGNLPVCCAVAVAGLCGQVSTPTRGGGGVAPDAAIF